MTATIAVDEQEAGSAVALRALADKLRACRAVGLAEAVGGAEGQVSGALG